MGPLTSNSPDLEFKCCHCRCSFGMIKALKVHLVARHFEIFMRDLFTDLKPYDLFNDLNSQSSNCQNLAVNDLQGQKSTIETISCESSFPQFSQNETSLQNEKVDFHQNLPNFSRNNLSSQSSNDKNVEENEISANNATKKRFPNQILDSPSFFPPSKLKRLDVEVENFLETAHNTSDMSISPIENDAETAPNIEDSVVILEYNDENSSPLNENDRKDDSVICLDWAKNQPQEPRLTVTINKNEDEITCLGKIEYERSHVPIPVPLFPLRTVKLEKPDSFSYSPQKIIVSRYKMIRNPIQRDLMVHRRPKELARKARRAPNQPYFRLSASGQDSQDLTKDVVLFEHRGTWDLLSNLTCKSTKLFRQRNLYVSELTQGSDPPRFEIRHRRQFNKFYFGCGFAFNPTVLNFAGFPISHTPIDKYARKAKIYDHQMNRLQTHVEHSVQDLLHLVNLKSLAGENGQENLISNNEVCKNDNVKDDSCTKALLNSYKKRLEQL